MQMSTALANSGSKSFWTEENNYTLTGGEQCRGCGSLLGTKLILRTIYEANPHALVFGRSCGGGRAEMQTGGRIGCDGSGTMGIQMALEARGEMENKKLVVLSGEGRTLEMGAGDFISAFDRQQKVSFIILDNQAYSSSGSASTSTTPMKAATRILTRASGGKETAERDMPLMMVFGNARYVATAVSAYTKDLVAKVREALECQPSYLHVVVPCQISWMYRPDDGVQLSRKLVQSGMVPLWSFKEGVFKRTVKIRPKDRRPVRELMGLQRRYENITEEDLDEVQAQIEHKNNVVEALEKTLTTPWH